MEIIPKPNTLGSKILKENHFFKEFISLMNNTEFKQFYDTYFNDWSDIQTMIFYMKLHSTIEYEYSIMMLHPHLGH